MHSRAARPTVITEESLGPASLAAVSNSRLLSSYFRSNFGPVFIADVLSDLYILGTQYLRGMIRLKRRSRRKDSRSTKEGSPLQGKTVLSSRFVNVFSDKFDV